LEGCTEGEKPGPVSVRFCGDGASNPSKLCIHSGFGTDLQAGKTKVKPGGGKPPKFWVL